MDKTIIKLGETEIEKYKFKNTKKVHSVFAYQQY